MPPWVIPKSACPVSFLASLHLFAQRSVPGATRRHSRGRGIGNALIEGHDDVGAQRFLDIHRRLGRDEVLRPAVEMRLERHTLLGDLAKVRQAEDLEAAAVRGTEPFQPMNPW